MINQLLSRIESFICRPWLNIPLTIYLNFRLCKFRDALHLPLYVYGHICFSKSLGNILFPNGCYKGMVTIGKTSGHFFSRSRPVYLLLDEGAKIICSGKASIGEGVSLRLTKNAELCLGSFVNLSDNVEIMCERLITIGEKTIITFGSKVIDTNFHYILDIDKSKIYRKNMPIHIGSRNWIANNVTIMKGTITPDDCIVASGSLLNKNYGDTQFVILAGSPANVVRNNKKRIFSCDTPSISESEIDNFFSLNDIDYMMIDKTI